MEELEYVLIEISYANDPQLLSELSKKRGKLEEQYDRYKSLLFQLERVTKAYEELSADIRTNLLGKHLKELQKTVKPECPGYIHLHQGVQLLYGR